jgi:hypothetical protein
MTFVLAESNGNSDPQVDIYTLMDAAREWTFVD